MRYRSGVKSILLLFFVQGFELLCKIIPVPGFTFPRPYGMIKKESEA